MAYTPREIKDRVAVGDDIFIVEDLGNNRTRLIPAPTHVLEPGTPVNKALLQPIEDELANLSATKVDKVPGKGLSTNDFTNALKNKLDGIEAGAQVNTVTSVAGKTGAVTLTKSDVGLGSVQNYGVATQAQAEAGTSNSVYMTPLRVKEAINSLAPVKSVAGKTGAVTLTKSDVGLGNVQNYGIATQAQAQAGTANDVYMTPLRVKEAINSLTPVRIAQGSYVGNSPRNEEGEITVNVGFTPKIVVVMRARSDFMGASNPHAVALTEAVGQIQIRGGGIRIITNGFIARADEDGAGFNQSGITYRYFAIA